MAFDFPASPTNGATYTPAGGPTYVFNNSVWRLGVSSTAAAAASIGDTAPTTPLPGQIWWESDSGGTFIWYVDANSGQWIQINGAGVPDAPADGKTYSRSNSAWVEGYSKVQTDAAKVARAGDTMTGDLTISKANPATVMNMQASGEGALLLSMTATKNRWAVYLGNTSPESGSNAGSDFSINNFSDAGVYIGTPLSIARSTGIVTIPADKLTVGGVYVAPRPQAGGGLGQVQNLNAAIGNGLSAPNGGGTWLCITFYWSSASVWAGGPIISIVNSGAIISNGIANTYQTCVCWRIS